MTNYQTKFYWQVSQRWERINLAYGDKTVTEEKYIVTKFKDPFEKIVETLKINRLILSYLSDDPVLNAIETFLRNARNSSDCFSSKSVTIEDICKEILALATSKATQSDDMSTNIIKNNSDNFF